MIKRQLQVGLETIAGIIASLLRGCLHQAGLTCLGTIFAVPERQVDRHHGHDRILAAVSQARTEGIVSIHIVYSQRDVGIVALPCQLDACFFLLHQVIEPTQVGVALSHPLTGLLIGEAGLKLGK